MTVFAALSPMRLPASRGMLKMDLRTILALTLASREQGATPADLRHLFSQSKRTRRTHYLIRRLTREGYLQRRGDAYHATPRAQQLLEYVRQTVCAHTPIATR
jgi:hypothetical protein